jgi:hypothetical protein
MSKQANENTDTKAAERPKPSRKKTASTTTGITNPQDGLDAIHAVLDHYRNTGGVYEVFPVVQRGGVAIFLADTVISDGLLRYSGNQEVAP